jgi:histidinol-phosphate/aromatic aminotransferase/cobyric acid decarboxylase-like protein
VPRKPDFSLDVDGIVRAVNRHGPKLVFLTSPNNPDGRYNAARIYTFLDLMTGFWHEI